MSDLKNKLQHLISGQIPDYLKATYPQFVNFIREYYKFLDTNRQANDLLLNSDKWTDVDKTISLFLEEMHKQYAFNISPDVAVDRRRLLKFIHQYYEIKGSENAAELYFRMMYNDEARVKYPGDYVLRASDGHWNIRKTVKVDTDYSLIKGVALNSAPHDFAQIELHNDVITDKASPLSVFDLLEKTIYLQYQVPNYTTLEYEDKRIALSCLYVTENSNNPDIFELDVHLSNTIDIQSINDELISEAKNNVVWVVAKDSAGVEYVYGFLTRQIVSYVINSGGENFRLRDTFLVDEIEENLSEDANPLMFINNGIIRVNKLERTTEKPFFSQEYTAYDEEYVVSVKHGIIKSFNILSTGYRFDNTTAYFAEDYTDGIDGLYTIIEDNRSRYFGEDYCSEDYTSFSEFTLDFTNPHDATSDVATVTFTVGYIYTHHGTWKDNAGFVSDVNKLQDNHYYQSFSYVIQTVNTPYTKWNSLYRNSAHPAGFEVFGELLVEQSINLTPVNITSPAELTYVYNGYVYPDYVTFTYDITVDV